ncbi:MAG: hypothetical protein FWE76_04150 [Symbiobacteriaceae bacterium]|nr:hypothetical protein [Symbiobacteriaceae bacterium]
MKYGIQLIANRISEEAEAHNRERYEQIRSSIDEVIQRENSFYEESYQKRRELVLRQNELEYTRLLDHLKARFSREIMAYEHGLIDGIFALAVQKLIEAPAADFMSLFLSAIAGLSGSYTLYIGELSRHKFSTSEAVRAIAAAENLQISISSEPVFGKSGFLLRNERVEYNCLFEDLIEELRAVQSAQILKEVFP